LPAIFTNQITILAASRIPKSHRELRKPAEFQVRFGAPAQSAEHTPVNELHSIENAQLTNSFFPLTKKIQGVKHNCSLTVSEVFPVGAASGGQAKSPEATCQERS
jgi:hypothetical protein